MAKYLGNCYNKNCRQIFQKAQSVHTGRQPASKKNNLIYMQNKATQRLAFLLTTFTFEFESN